MTITYPPMVHIPNGLELTRLAQLHQGVKPSDGRPLGDCYRTSLGCLLGVDHPEAVPHFVDIVEDLPAGTTALGWETHRLARLWLRTLELDLWCGDLDWAAEVGQPFAVTVKSRRGPWGHVLVAQGHEIVHDPNASVMAVGEEPYSWSEAVAYGGDALVIVLPYDPDPDTELAHWRSLEAAGEITVEPEPAPEPAP